MLNVVGNMSSIHQPSIHSFIHPFLSSSGYLMRLLLLGLGHGESRAYPDTPGSEASSLQGSKCVLHTHSHIH